LLKLLAEGQTAVRIESVNLELLQETLVEARTGRMMLPVSFKDSDFPSQVNDIEFSPDGNLLLTGGNDHTVKLWRITRT